MKILYEDTIPRGREYFSTLGEARSYAAADVTPHAVSWCDYLAVRSTTPVNETLLQQAESLRLVATATAGSNHLDKTYLQGQGIPWHDAGGCNAIAVAEYVVSILLTAHQQEKLDLSRIRVGIVGAGHVGTALSNLLNALGIAFVLNDPPREQNGDKRNFVGLEEALCCDVVTLHVPFVKDGLHPTVNLLNEKHLAALNSSQLLINACRGEVIDENALLQRLRSSQPPLVALDVYQNEPHINRDLLAHLWLATGHTAGHSVEGKLRGTQMVYEQFCEHAQKPVKLQLDDFLVAPEAISFTAENPSMEALNWDELCALLLSMYAVTEDDHGFRQAMKEEGQFSEYRKQYRVRREFNAYTLQLNGVVSEGILRQLTGLGFVIETL
ncbi:4-phosphoerythronate dehydrogenase [Salinimonas chungwhensis]|uniref:4-phosphoerythronate dehydrogenase n=1 Tax=Salinimonas chungwhensis TaxID=265425 RepID=UPI00036712D3|nr:4-phosphoerythronate dehydrogenase [Salinimonas chungwhensis]